MENKLSRFQKNLLLGAAPFFPASQSKCGPSSSESIVPVLSTPSWWSLTPLTPLCFVPIAYSFSPPSCTLVSSFPFLTYPNPPSYIHRLLVHHLLFHPTFYSSWVVTEFRLPSYILSLASFLLATRNCSPLLSSTTISISRPITSSHWDLWEHQTKAHSRNLLKPAITCQDTYPSPPTATPTYDTHQRTFYAHELLAWSFFFVCSYCPFVNY